MAINLFIQISQKTGLAEKVEKMGNIRDPMYDDMPPLVADDAPPRIPNDMPPLIYDDPMPALPVLGLHLVGNGRRHLNVVVDRALERRLLEAMLTFPLFDDMDHADDARNIHFPA